MSSSSRAKTAKQEQNRAELVCHTCKLSKRQCDKRLPTCSRCKKLNRECEYRTDSQPETVTRPTESGSLVTSVASNACLRCKLNKRRCDRITPKCSRCSRIGARCVYQASPQLNTAPEPDDYTDLVQQETWFAPLAQTEIGLDFEPPIRCRSYMPELMNFFLTSIALPSDKAVGYSLAHHLRSQWMQHAMTDPCLFHATLFSASASIDMLRGKQITARTLYHQTWAMRLINERLAQPAPVLTYGTLGAVIPLLYYNMVALERDTAVAHQKGLVKMLIATPQSFRADIEPLIAIVKIAMLSFACIYDAIPIWRCLFSESVRPNTILRNLVSNAIFGNSDLHFQKETTDAILDVYEAMSRLDHLTHADCSSISAEVEWALSSARTNTLPQSVDTEHEITLQERLNICCQISCRLFWKGLRGQAHPQSKQALEMTGDDEAQQLLIHLSNVEPSYWIRIAPEVFTWAVFTGAAVSENQSVCAAFMGKAGTILTAIDDEKLTFLRQGWRYFSLLKTLGCVMT